MLADGDSTAIVRAILCSPGRSAWRRPPRGSRRDELAETLAELGCTYGQGFYYAEALPADDALAYWLERSA